MKVIVIRNGRVSRLLPAEIRKGDKLFCYDGTPVIVDGVMTELDSGRTLILTAGNVTYSADLFLCA